jgi:hypothetical protein
MGTPPLKSSCWSVFFFLASVDLGFLERSFKVQAHVVNYHRELHVRTTHVFFSALLLLIRAGLYNLQLIDE